MWGNLFNLSVSLFLPLLSEDKIIIFPLQDVLKVKELLCPKVKMRSLYRLRIKRRLAAIGVN